MQAAEAAIPTYVGGGSKRRRKMSLQEGQRRSASEGQRRGTRKTNVSRDSSTGSSAMSLDVRCACQYFQSDSLLPDRINPMGTRPNSRLSNMVSKFGYVLCEGKHRRRGLDVNTIYSGYTKLQCYF